MWVTLTMLCRGAQGAVCARHGGSLLGDDLGPRDWAEESNSPHLSGHDGVWTEKQRQLQTGQFFKFVYLPVHQQFPRVYSASSNGMRLN